MDDKKIKNKKRRKCNICKCLKYDVKTQINPFIEDIEGRIVKESICHECYNNLIADI